MWMPRETEILANTRQFLIANSLFYFPLALVNIVRFTIQGLGYSKFAIIAGVCEMAARSFVGFCLVPFFGYAAVCFANPIAWVAADLFLIPAYRYVMGRLRRLMGRNNPGMAAGDCRLDRILRKLREICSGTGTGKIRWNKLKV